MQSLILILKGVCSATTQLVAALSPLRRHSVSVLAPPLVSATPIKHFAGFRCATLCAHGRGRRSPGVVSQTPLMHFAYFW